MREVLEPMSNRTILIGGAVALVVLMLGITGALFNPKPPPANPAQSTEETNAAAKAAGAAVSQTPAQK